MSANISAHIHPDTPDATYTVFPGTDISAFVAVRMDRGSLSVIVRTPAQLLQIADTFRQAAAALDEQITQDHAAKTMA